METATSKLTPQTSPVTEIDISKLPSKGLTYPEGATISFRTYGYGEIKKISSSNMSDKEAFALVLSGINTNFNKLDITFGDFMYLSLFRKIATLGTTKFQVPYKTPINNDVKYHIMSVEDLEIEDLKAPKLPVKVSFTDGSVISFKPLTVGSVLDLISAKKIKDATALMAAQVVGLSFDDANAYLHSVTNRDDLSALGEVESILSHNIKPIRLNCTETNEDGKEVTNTITLRLEGRQALLMPFREEGVPSRSRISFG